jgi:DtxR family transcriptional regulator, Mn-dependent transcriptional regulator
MPSPAVSLALGILLAVLAMLLLWPDRGLWHRLRQAFRASERVLTEDALKHVFDCEYHALPCTRQSAAGALCISESRAAELLGRMEELEMIESKAGGYRLTASGRSDALRIVRIHRLLERYFSEETGLGPDRWHSAAESLEHKVSGDEADRLSRRMDHPRFDPHGDPIPTREGEIPPRAGSPLADLPLGQIAEIVHIEDEPESHYAQLVAEGLHLGMKVRVTESTPRRIRFEADAEEYVLAPMLAANVSVVAIDSDEMPGPYPRLSTLALGDSAQVEGFTPMCRGAERRRLLDLGLLPGTEVTAELRSPGGDPTGYRIRGAVIALRRAQADQIQIRPGSES